MVSRWDRIKNAYKSLRGRRDETAFEISVGQSSIKTITDGKMEYRLSQQEEIFDFLEEKKEHGSPSEWIGDLRTKFYKLNRLVKNSIPYARLGSSEELRVMILNWEQLYHIGLNYINYKESGFKRKKQEVDELLPDIKGEGEEAKKRKIRKKEQINYITTKYMHTFFQLESYFNLDFFPVAHWIVDVCWKDKDVTPQHVTVIQSFSDKKGVQQNI